MKHLLAYVAILVGFVVIDMIWLLGVARGTYVVEMGALMRKQPNLVAAGLFYLVYALGVWFFAVRASADGQTVLTAMAAGAMLGLVAYGTYDFTNLSVVEGFGVKIAVIDLAWGIVLSTIASGIGAVTLRWLN